MRRDLTKTISLFLCTSSTAVEIISSCSSVNPLSYEYRIPGSRLQGCSYPAMQAKDGNGIASVNEERRSDGVVLCASDLF